MNNILRKCLEELNKPEVKLDYVRGMLETLLEMQSPAPMSLREASHPVIEAPLPPPPDLMLIKALAEKSLHEM